MQMSAQTKNVTAAVGQCFPLLYNAYHSKNNTEFLIIVLLKLSSTHSDDAVHRELGIELLSLVPGTKMAVARLCSRCAASMSEINRLHQLVISSLPFTFHFVSFSFISTVCLKENRTAKINMK